MYAARMFFCEEIEEENIVVDEIDELFSKLEQVEPPASLIEGILAAAARLPLPQYLPSLNEAEADMYEPGIIIEFPSGSRLFE